MATKMIPRVVLSLQALLTGPQGQARIKFSFNEEEFPRVRIPELGLDPIPILVAIRLVLTKIVDNAQNWELSVAPFEPRLLTRLLGRPSGRLDDVSYQVTKLLKEALKVISILEPPEGTVIQATFTYTRNGEPRWDWYVSTTEPALRRHEVAQRRNELTLANSFGFGWLRRAIAWGLVEVPPMPGEDLWMLEHRSEFESNGAEYLFTVLQSLWKATFAEGPAAAELMAEGYAMQRIGTTQLGHQGLRQVMAGARDRRLTSITQLG